MSSSDRRTGTVLDERLEVDLEEMCRACGLRAEEVFELIDLGVVEPSKENTDLRFTGVCLYKARVAGSLRRDLGVNFAGAALVLDLLEELRVLRARLRAETREF